MEQCKRNDPLRESISRFASEQSTNTTKRQDLCHGMTKSPSLCLLLRSRSLPDTQRKPLLSVETKRSVFGEFGRKKRKRRLAQDLVVEMLRI